MSHPKSPFPHLTNLLSETLGSRAIACSDDFFASMCNLTRDAEPVFDPDAYYDRGKVMDGWESRRKRGPGQDWCILALGRPGVVSAVDVDTRHFTGNHAPWASLEGCFLPGDPTAEALEAAEWTELMTARSLDLGSSNILPLDRAARVTHVKLNIFPDGGVARLKLYGRVDPPDAAEFDVAALENGGKALACSDMYFGVMDHLIAPGRAEDMRGGWETRRRRGQGHDWVLLRLAKRSTLRRLLIDTNHFKGNFPDTARIEGIDWEEGSAPLLLESERWESVLPEVKLCAHEERHIDLDDVGPYTHLRLEIRPCGGVSRLRVFGQPTQGLDALVSYYNELGETEAIERFLSCCGSVRWAERMAASRPFAHRGALFSEARRHWARASQTDLLEAFSHHPRIGEDPERLRKKFAATAQQSEAEQSGVVGAPAHVLDALTRENAAYEEKFGHVFLVCATGKSASEMLAILRDRIRNTAERELREAAEQQARITAIRLVNGAHA